MEKKPNEEHCPYCKANLVEDLPEHLKKDGNYFRYRKIGISNWDSVFAWECEFCKGRWKR